MRTIYLDSRPIQPGKIICVGRNYIDHIDELGNEVPEEMVVFLKPNTAISTDTLRSRHGEALHYETEISYVVEAGKLTGVGIGLDLTKRQLQTQLKTKGLPWERAKAFDGAAVFSEFVPLKNTTDPLEIKLFVNDELRQNGSTDQMIYQPAEILREASSFLTMNDGDIIMTGTPKGVGLIEPGANYLAQLLQNDEILLEAHWIAAHQD